MASTSTPVIPSSSSSSSTYRPKYEVFLSFRGPDTRHGFTDHLYAALKRMGIVVFRDDEELQGEEIHPGLKDAIKESQYAIVVISKDFAGSKSCLFELTMITERKRMGFLTVFPVFYHVDPSDVQNQGGSFGDAFIKLKNDLKADTTKWECWKAILNKLGGCSANSSKVTEDPLKSFGDALEEVSKVCGWHVKEDRYQSEIIEEICLKIFRQLMHYSTRNFESLVGIETPAKEIMELLDLESGDVRFIGICGMGGIGKTTLADVVYNIASPKFEAHCFILNIGESENNQLTVFQRQIISAILSLEVEKSLLTDHAVIKAFEERLSNKKALIVLDNVSHRDQVKALAGSRHWFGEGSRIIITSRNYLPTYLQKDNIYEVRELEGDTALELFYSKAFQNGHLKEEFMELSKDIVDFAKGLPLALEVFGSYVCGEEKSIWESYLVGLKRNLDPDVGKKLRITFDGLGKSAQEMFLDIVCFFNEKYKEAIIFYLKHLGYPAESILKDLECKSLIKSKHIGNSEILFVHDLLKQMGQEIAGHSRLWRYKDVINVLREKTGIADVIGLYLVIRPFDKENKKNIHTRLFFEALSKMENLKMLIIEDSLGILTEGAMRNCYNILKFNDKLRVLDWGGYPFESLPASSQPADLIMPDLPVTCIKSPWSGYKHFQRLKIISLSESSQLIEMTDLSQFPKLEILDLSYCEGLTTVHSSTELHECLKEFRLEYCSNLKQLPNKISLKSLQILTVSHCSKLKSFPDISGEMPSFHSLDISGTAVEEFPFSYLRLPSLKEFSARETLIRELPFDILFSKELKILVVVCVDSNTTTWHPISFSPLSSLKGLLNAAAPIDPDGLSMYSGEQSEELLEAPFSRLRSLSVVEMSYCNLEAIPKSIGCWSLVETLKLSGNRFTELPNSMCELFKLKFLYLDSCTSLRVLPKLPLRLKLLSLENCPSLKGFNDIRTAQNSGEMLRTSNRSFVVTYVSFGCKPHKILYPSRQSLKNGFDIQPEVACCPVRELGVRERFIHRSTSNSGKKIEIDVYWIFRSHFLGFRKHVLALLVVYEVCGHDKRDREKGKLDLNIAACEDSTNPDIGANEDSNCIFPEFACEFQVNARNWKDTIVVSVPEVVPAGSHGLWLLMRDPFSMYRPGIYCLVSITAINENVVLKECGARLLDINHRSELSQVVNQPDLDFFLSDSFVSLNVWT